MHAVISPAKSLDFECALATDSKLRSLLCSFVALRCNQSIELWAHRNKGKGRHVLGMDSWH
jgi:hypothetical protein